MNAAADLQALRSALEDLHLAASDATLDARTQGPNVAKNRSTLSNHLRFNDSANLVKGLLHVARASVDREPTAANLSALRGCERALNRLIDSLESSLLAPPTHH